MPVHLELVDDITVHMAPGMYSWCTLLTFAIPATGSGTDVINSVLAHPRYGDDCASPWTGKPDPVHGPYRLESLNSDGFQRCSRAEAVASLWSWPAANLSTADEIYRLSAPREGNEHSYGWVVGLNGFHEFVAVCRQRAAATVIIASDD